MCAPVSDSGVTDSVSKRRVTDPFLKGVSQTLFLIGTARDPVYNKGVTDPFLTGRGHRSLSNRGVTHPVSKRGVTDPVSNKGFTDRF